MKEVFVVEEKLNIKDSEWALLMVCDQLNVAQLEIINYMDGWGKAVRVDDYRWQFVSEKQLSDNGEPKVIASFVIRPTPLVTFRDPHNKGEQE